VKDSRQRQKMDEKMKPVKKISEIYRQSKPGFTLLELLVASAVMLIVILGTLSLYMRSNKISVDQQQIAEIQHDVRTSMFFISRDVRSAGVGLTLDIAGYFLEGKDGFGPAPESSDYIKLLGNFDDPLAIKIRQYQGGGGGGAATAFLYEFELENSPYECPDYYENRNVIIVSTKCPGCFAFRYVPQNSVFGCGSGVAHINMQPGQSELNPPGGLVDTGCSGDCYDDGILTFGQIKQYWLDTTGNPGDYPGLNLTLGQDGYLGLPNVLYLTTVDDSGTISHMPLAQNIENLQFQYNLVDGSGNFLGFSDWQDTWTQDDISRIRQVRIWILGKTPKPMVSISANVPANLYLYRRPAVANSPAAGQADRHRRFLLDSTVNIRNLTLSIYNTGTR